MTRSAPSDRTSSTLPGPQTPVTPAPRCLASCTAYVPMLPDAPLMSTVCPRRGLFVGRVGRHVGQGGRLGHGLELRASADAEPGEAEHRVTDAEPADPGGDRHDVAGHLDAEHAEPASGLAETEDHPAPP